MDIILILLIIFIPIIAQIGIKSAYSNNSRIENDLKITGKDVARKILDKNGLQNIDIVCINGELTDHYDPRKKRISLSTNIYNGTSISSAAVAAHEVGHAIQDKKGYFYLRLRSFLVPIVNIASHISTIFIFIGFTIEALDIVNIGIYLLLVGLLFQLITLPVEFNASSRAKVQLKECGLLSDENTSGTNSVLNAAALTYVAGFLAQALQIFRLILISRDNNK